MLLEIYGDKVCTVRIDGKVQQRQCMTVFRTVYIHATFSICRQDCEPTSEIIKVCTVRIDSKVQQRQCMTVFRTVYIHAAFTLTVQ